MHIQTVRFERVFDVQSGTFSFEANGKRQFGITFDHRHVPAVGDACAVVLAEPGNWQSIEGWRDLATPRVGFTRSAWSIASDHLYYLWLFGLIFPAAALVVAGVWAALSTIAAILLGSGFIIRGAVLHNRKIASALLAVPPPAALEVMPASQRGRNVA